MPSAENGLISKDGLTYTFPIRKGVRFHHGEELTPEDVRYSLLRFLLSDVAGGPSSLLLEPILGVSSTRDEKGKIAVSYKEATQAVRVDGDNIVITLKRPFAPFCPFWRGGAMLSAKSGPFKRARGTARKKLGSSLTIFPKNLPLCLTP